MGDKNNESTPKEECNSKPCGSIFEKKDLSQIQENCDIQKNNDSSLNKPQTIRETVKCEPRSDQGPDTDRDETIKDDPNQKETYLDETNQNGTDWDEKIKDYPNQKETYQNKTNQNEPIKPAYDSESMTQGKHCKNDGQPAPVTAKFFIQPEPVSQIKHIEKVVQPKPVTARFFIQPEPVTIFEPGELIEYFQPEQKICHPEESEKCETASESESESDIEIINVKSVIHDVGLSGIEPIYDSEPMTLPDGNYKNETDQHLTVQEDQDQDKTYQDGTEKDNTVYKKKDPAIIRPIGPAYDSESMTAPEETYKKKTVKCELLKSEIVGETGKCDPPKGGPGGPDGPDGPGDPSDQ